MSLSSNVHLIHVNLLSLFLKYEKGLSPYFESLELVDLTLKENNAKKLSQLFLDALLFCVYLELLLN